MDVLQRPTPAESSTLNPNAPIFIPMSSYQTIEDFSDQWWDLVHSSPWFRDYWLQDCFLDHHVHDDHDDDDLLLPDFDAFFDSYLTKNEKEMEEKEKRGEKEMIRVGALKWSKPDRRGVEASRNMEKIPKIVKSVRMSPRLIQQPR